MKFGKLQLIDTVHVVADVNLEKDKARQEKGKPPRDGNATWGVKGNKQVVSKDGRREKKSDYFYGYKEQVSLNAEPEMITTVKPRYGDEYDGCYLPWLVERDLKKGINSAIRLKDFRTQKKEGRKHS